jgi:hypothetical protein
MKKLIIVLVILLTGIISKSQEDTTFVIVNDTVEIENKTLLFESEFKTFDIVNFDINADSSSWHRTKWINKKTTIINANTKRITQVQFRINDQGIKQRRIRIIRCETISKIRRRIVYN